MSKTTENHTPRLRPSPRTRWYKFGAFRCSGPECTKRMPAGYYGIAKKLYLCSGTCSTRYYCNRREPVACTFCGKSFRRQHTQRSMPFCSMDHYYKWRRKQTDEEKSGAYAPVLQEYLEAVIPRFLAAATFNQVRCNLSAFFHYLRLRRIRSLNTVTPKTISGFLTELQTRRIKSAGRVTGNVRLFFDWLIFTGKRRLPNPVIPKFHTSVTITRLPRPYESNEMEDIRTLAEQSGDLRLCLAIAIGEESGLRISEICNLRLQDIDLEKYRLFVRLPNKTNRERFASFHTRTRTLMIRWLSERADVGHDFLFTGWRERPLRKHSLRILTNRALCGEGKLISFSYHRLRHTAASKVYPAMDPLSVMHTFGWESQKVMQNYTRLLPQTARESYARAMDKVEVTSVVNESQPESIEAYFASRTSPK
jgi:site-specific recombinase XerD